jgi:hypothetical protein
MTPAMMADRLYRARRARDEAFGADGFGEPAWDMLLWILAHEGDGTELTVDAVLAAAATPATIARPYLDWLATRDLVSMEPPELTPRGRRELTRYLQSQTGVSTGYC